MKKAFLIAAILTAFAAAALLAQDGAQATAATAAKAVLAEQTLCPVSGKPINKDSYVDVDGHRVYFCCQNCPKKFAAFPDKYLAEMLAQGVRPESLQKVCPISGEAIDESQFVEVLNKRIYTCCARCLKKVEAEPARYLDVVAGRPAQMWCPVMDEAIPPDSEEMAVIEIQGQKVNLCCESCEKKIRKNPDKYFAVLAEKNMVAQPASLTCPVSGKEGQKNVFLTWMGRRYHFCCTKCIATFTKDPASFVAKL